MPNDLFDKKFRKRWIWGSLLLICTGIAIAIFALSLRLYTTWYRTHRPLHRANDMSFHTSLFISSCAPLCTTLGFLAGTLHYKRKRAKFGKYDVRMRRQGRGYWIDPTDAEDKSKELEAKKLNEHLKGGAGPLREEVVVKTWHAHRKTMLNPMNWGFGHHYGRGDEEFLPTHLNAPASGPGHMSILNPYGWYHNKPSAPSKPPAVQRSDSLRTCDNDETTKKGVQSIWLKDKLRESARNGYEGREKRRENWEEDVGKELDAVGGSAWWWEKGKGGGKK
ncbi:hypothetical protein CC86DRAFT_362691 [Ophiobolus disseminans]|uniref:Uncharacterized protein n=1 Tax=Ophiobolus disseminans TaxID=1469910 RepID=A0A6A6ZG36_9PLEO|nr:hypothetical protein CC86DRAFT_362691 [Ophiobolus disseminans]